MDFRIILTTGMGHDQLEVVTAVGHERIDQEFSFLLFQHLRGLLKEQGVGAGVSREAADISFYQGDCGLGHVSILRSILTY